MRERDAAAGTEHDPGATGPLKEVTCPACGGLVEATDDAELIALANEHTRDAHGYSVPADHVLCAARVVPPARAAPPAPTGTRAGSGLATHPDVGGNT